jgi:hypothetical protein
MIASYPNQLGYSGVTDRIWEVMIVGESRASSHRSTHYLLLHNISYFVAPLSSSRPSRPCRPSGPTRCPFASMVSTKMRPDLCMSCWNALRMNIRRSVGLMDKTPAAGARDSRLESLADQSDCLSVLYSYLCLFDTGNQFLGTTTSKNHAGSGKKLSCSSLSLSHLFLVFKDKDRTRERIAYGLSPYLPGNGWWKPR